MELSLSVLFAILTLELAACGTKQGEQSNNRPTKTPGVEAPSNPSTNAPTPPQSVASASPKLLLSYQGKGTKGGWDAGVMKSLYDTKRFHDGEIIFTGNSSGAVLAALSACHGLTAEGIAAADLAVKSLNRSMVNEDTFAKLPDILIGKDPAFPASAITPYIELVTTPCDVQHLRPIIIGVSNQEVLKNTAALRTVNLDNLDMLDGTTVIGKICTYFATPDIATQLNNIPASERQCDVRRIDTIEDLRLAVLASVSEPTYFPAVVENELSKYLSQSPGGPRSYIGGFAAQNLAQDVRRLIPGLKALGSGRPYYSTTESTFIRALFHIGVNDILARAKYWYDMEINPNDNDWTVIENKTTDPTTAMNLGYAAASTCFMSNHCLDSDFKVPHFQDYVSLQNQNVPTRGGLKP